MATSATHAYLAPYGVQHSGNYTCCCWLHPCRPQRPSVPLTATYMPSPTQRGEVSAKYFVLCHRITCSASTPQRRQRFTNVHLNGFWMVGTSPWEIVKPDLTGGYACTRIRKMGGHAMQMSANYVHIDLCGYTACRCVGGCLHPFFYCTSLSTSSFVKLPGVRFYATQYIAR